VLAGWLFRQELGLDGSPPHPAIDVERRVDLGEHELSLTLEPSVIVRNKGRKPLIVNELTPSCGCLGVFAQRASGEREKVGTLVIPPRGQETMVLQLAVIGPPGIPVPRTVQFRTNDPRNPTVEITLWLTPTARYFAEPASLTLGTVPVGDHVERDIQVKAFDRTLPAITRAVSSNDHVHATYQPAAATADEDPGAKTCVVAGGLHVSFEAPEAPGAVSGIVALYCEGRQDPVVTISITGRIAARVELSPQEINLPRVSESGPVYTASCLCRSALPGPLTLTAQDSPQELVVEIKEVPDNPSLKVVHIDATRFHDSVAVTSPLTKVTLLAEADGQRIPLTLTLTIQNPERP